MGSLEVFFIQKISGMRFSVNDVTIAKIRINAKTAV